MTIAECIELRGFERGVQEVARKLLTKEANAALIAEVTGLSLEQIDELKTEEKV